MLQVCLATETKDKCNTNCDCPIATPNCLASGKCVALVPSLVAKVNEEAPPFPDQKVRRGTALAWNGAVGYRLLHNAMSARRCKQSASSYRTTASFVLLRLLS